MRHHQANPTSSFIPPSQTNISSPQAQTDNTAYLPLTPEQQAHFEANTRRIQARVHQAYVDMQAQRAEGQATAVEPEEQAQSYVRHPYWQAMYDEQEAKQAQQAALASSAPSGQAMEPETEEDPDLQARAAAAGRHPYWQAAHEQEEARQAKAAKGNWQQQADPHNIFSNPSALPSGVMAQYERLMPGVKLGEVQLHQGAGVDAALQGAGLHGLTDGTNVAVSSKAPADTLPHELGHVAQRQEAGFSLTEGSRAGYERDADGIAAQLVANQPVERFENAVQGKAEECEEGQKSNALTAQLMAAAPVGAQGLGIQPTKNTQAKPTSTVPSVLSLTSASFNAGTGGALSTALSSNGLTIDSAPFSPSGSVQAKGGRNIDAQGWEAGFIQTVMSAKRQAHYKGSKNQKTLTIALPGSTRDAISSGGAPWYDPTNANGNGVIPFTQTNSVVNVDLWDRPSITFPWQTPDGRGNLTHTTGKDIFTSWMIVRQIKAPNTIQYLNWTSWEVDYSTTFNQAANGAQTLAVSGGTNQTGSGSGQGSSTPVLSGAIANNLATIVWK